VAENTVSPQLREQRNRELIRQAASLLAADMSLGTLFERLCEMLADYIDAKQSSTACSIAIRMHACTFFMLMHWPSIGRNIMLTWNSLTCTKFCRRASLHDVGELLISDRILVKPSKLTSDEYRAIQYHAEYGMNILARYPGYGEVAEIVGQHHERFDWTRIS